MDCTLTKQVLGLFVMVFYNQLSVKMELGQIFLTVKVVVIYYFEIGKHI